MVHGGYLRVPGGYIMVPGGYIMVPGGDIMVLGGYIMVPGGYINKGVLLSCFGQLKRGNDQSLRNWYSRFS